MGKYGKYGPRVQVKPRPWKIHPIWRGIGCLLMIIIPILSYAGATLLVQENLKQRWWVIPSELTRTINVPFLGNIPYLIPNLVVTLLLMLVGFGVVTVVYMMIYRVVGPKDPLEAKPQRWTSRRRK